MGSGVGQDVFEKKGICYPCQEMKHSASDVQSVVQSLYLLSYTVQIITMIIIIIIIFNVLAD